MRARVRSLVESLDVEQILPQCYVSYRPLLVDGLCFFLERMPAHRLAEIVSDQFEMAADTGFADRVLALLHRCPTLHKLGQIVSRDRRLSNELRQRLQSLESVTPTTRLDDLPTDILQELENMGDIELSAHPLAEASVAVVLPFTWKGKRSRDPQHGVFKMLKPGVEERLFEELEIWVELGAFLEERCEHHGLPRLDYAETLDCLRRLLKQEVHFEREQKHLTEAADFYARDTNVIIPRLLPFCSSRITAMERVFGDKVTDVNIGSTNRIKLADRVFEALVARPFWTRAEVCQFHADPHAGNLFCTPDERLAIFDWTLVGRLDKQQRVEMVQMVLGGITLNETRICRAVSRLGRTQPDESRLRDRVCAALREVRQGCLPGFDWSQRLLDGIAASTGMGFPENLMLFRKALHTLSGVVADITTDCSLDRVMLNQGLRQFSGEWSSRMLADPASRSFGTHVSNVELMELMGSLPGTVNAYWLGLWQDSLDTLQRIQGRSH
jgi:ubiquinone biosynthesis protein